MRKFNLGDKVRDRVTLYVGIVMCRSEYLNGCVQYGVQSQHLSDGKPIDPVWFDDKQLDLLKRGVVKTESKRTGGPMPTPKKSRNPPTR